MIWIWIGCKALNWKFKGPTLQYGPTLVECVVYTGQYTQLRPFCACFHCTLHLHGHLHNNLPLHPPTPTHTHKHRQHGSGPQTRKSRGTQCRGGWRVCSDSSSTASRRGEKSGCGHAAIHCGNTKFDGGIYS